MLDESAAAAAFAFDAVSTTAAAATTTFQSLLPLLLQSDDEYNKYHNYNHNESEMIASAILSTALDTTTTPSANPNMSYMSPTSTLLAITTSAISSDLNTASFFFKGGNKVLSSTDSLSNGPAAGDDQWYQHTMHYHDSHDDSHVVFPATDARGRHMTAAGGGRDGIPASRQSFSEESVEKVSFIFVIILIPCFSIFGSVGNILSLIVLVHQRMRNATNTLLAALAISDLLVLMHAAYFSFLRIYKLKNPEQGNNIRTLTFPILGPYSSVLTARITTCLTTMLSLERLVAVYCPMTAKTRCSRSTTAMYIALIYIVTPLLFLPTAFKYHSSPKRIGNTTVLVMELTSFGQNKAFFAIYGNILNVLFRLLPIVILIVVNSLIAFAIRRVWSLRQSLSNSTSSSATSSFEQTRITLMLVMVSIVFLVCILPGAVHSIYTQIDKQYTRFGSERNMYNVVATVTYFLETVNSSVNFFIYMAFSKKFSRTYKEIFCCRRGAEIPHSNIRSIFKFSLRGSKTLTNTSSKGDHLHHSRKHQHSHHNRTNNRSNGVESIEMNGNGTHSSKNRFKMSHYPLKGTNV